MVQLPTLGSVGKHRPYLPRAGAGGLENEMASIRGPAGALVASHIARQFTNWREAISIT